MALPEGALLVERRCTMRGTQLGVLLPVMLLLTGCAQSASQPQSWDFFAMDTYMTFKVWPQDPALPERTRTEIERLESLLSVTRDGSDLDRINHACGTPVTVSPETAEIIQMGLSCGAETGGALNIAMYPVSKLWGFTQDTHQVPAPGEIADALEHTDLSRISVNGETITVPDGTELDLGALAKGYAGDRLRSVLQENGVTSGILSLGGNVEVIGTKLDGSPWRVGIADPFAPSEILCSVMTRSGAVVTSGSYQRYFEENGRRYHHILDPETGYPAEQGLVSVTVTGEDGVTCDALSTALFVMGKERAVAEWNRRQDFGMILITDEPALYYTEGLDMQDLPAIPVEVISHEP